MQSILSSRIVARLNVCADDPRLYDWANDFQERAWSYGRWWGSVQLMQFCLDSDTCLVLPREVAVIEKANLNGAHLNSTNQWFSFIAPHNECDAAWASTCSTGSCSCCGCGDIELQQKGTVASFATTIGSTKKLRIYPASSADAGKKIIFQGKDSNGIWVRTLIDGVVQDGEQVTLAMPFATTTTTWGPGAPYAVIKDVTSYRVLVYAYDAAADTETQIADYQPGETHPSYQRLQVPRTCCTGDACNSRSLLAIASLQHIPVTSANDWLLFTNLQAYSDGMLSAKLREEGNFALADAYFFGADRNAKPARGTSRHADGMGALSLLRAELRRMSGDTTSVQIQQTHTLLSNFL